MQGRRASGRFIAVYTVASFPLALKLLRKHKYSSLLKINKQSAKLAVVPAALPPLFALVHRAVERLGERFLLVSTDRKRVIASRISAVLCSPVLLLLPPGIRIHVVIYVLTGALRAFLQTTPDSGGNVNVLGWRRYLPPIWTLASSCTIMLPLWLLGPEGSFPEAYDRVIINFSTPYFPREPTPAAPLGVKYLLTHTSFPPTSPSSASLHSYQVCEALHPLEPSCAKNFVKATISQGLEAVKMVSTIEFIAALLRMRLKLFDYKTLPNTLKNILTGIASGALFVGGSISSSWATVCLLQRIIPQGRMLRSRFILNGTACVPWMLVLPESRRDGMAMYFFRMAMFGLVNFYKAVYGSRGMRRAEVMAFAASWVALLILRDNGHRLEKPAAHVLKLLDSELV